MKNKLCLFLILLTFIFVLTGCELGFPIPNFNKTSTNEINISTTIKRNTRIKNKTTTKEVLNSTTTKEVSESKTKKETYSRVSTDDDLDFMLLGDGTYEVKVNRFSTATDIVIPETYNGRTITAIAFEGFAHKSNIKSIYIPNTVNYIGENAFSECYSLKTINIPSNITSIEKSTFHSCLSLQSIAIPEDVDYIGPSAFAGCESLTSFVIPSKVTEIPNFMFDGCFSLKTITIHNNITSIGEAAFLGCSSLQTITIPDEVDYIGPCAFAGCESLISFVIPSKVTEINEALFESCFSLKTITIHNNITSIGEAAFACCSSLTSITIPKSITTLGNDLFLECSSLNSIIYSGSMNEWNSIKRGINLGIKNVRIVCNDGEILNTMEVMINDQEVEAMTKQNDGTWTGKYNLLCWSNICIKYNDEILWYDNTTVSGDVTDAYVIDCDWTSKLYHIENFKKWFCFTENAAGNEYVFTYNPINNTLVIAQSIPIV